MAKQPPKRKTRKIQGINTSNMTKVEPLTENQEKIFKAWDEGKHMFIYGCAGTGKTFCVLYKALYDVLKGDTQLRRCLPGALACTVQRDWVPSW
jgi:phosphate starvation-inducible protein PhoH